MNIDHLPELKNLSSSTPSFSDTTNQILKVNFDELSKEQYFDLIMNKLSVEQPVMQEEEIRSLFECYLKQFSASKNSNKILNYEFGRSLLHYFSNTKVVDEKTKYNTLDRAYIEYYNQAEKFPDEMSELTNATNSMEEYVNPDVFFDSYLKIKNSKVLNKYFGGKQFSQLEYNITYCGTKNYIESLLSKINFTDSVSCADSSMLMNLSASLADYAKNGSYSGNYKIDEKIIQGLESKSNEPDSIYLLGSKANYIIDRLKKNYSPFVHRNKIIEIAPNVLASLKKEGLFVLNMNDPELTEQYKNYISLCKELDTPPKHLVDLAIKNGQDFVNWEPDRDLMFQRKLLEDFLRKKMSLLKDVYFKKDSLAESQVKEYSNLIGTDYKVFLEEEFKMKLSDYPIQEQFYFLEYIQIQTNKSIKPVKEFTSKYGKNGFRTFLSIEHGGKEMGDKILTLGQKLPEDVAKKLFAKYAEYIDSVDNVESFIESELVGKKANPETIQKIKETLLLKGRDILLSQYEKVVGGKFDLEKFEEFINNAKADVDLFKNTFKTTLEENPDTSFENFLNLEATTKNSNEIHGKAITEIKDMIKRNYKDMDLQNAILESFEKSLKNPNTKISTLEREGRTIASDRLDFNEDGSIYFGTFNVDPDYCSAKIGNAFFKSTVAPYMKENIVQADCSIRQPISAYYIESGFVGTKLYDYKGEPSLAIETMPNKDFESKKLSKNEIMQIFNTGQAQDKYIVKKFATQSEIVQNYPADKMLTRFFYDSKSKYWFALWE